MKRPITEEELSKRISNFNSYSKKSGYLTSGILLFLFLPFVLAWLLLPGDAFDSNFAKLLLLAGVFVIGLPVIGGIIYFGRIDYVRSELLCLSCSHVINLAVVENTGCCKNCGERFVEVSEMESKTVKVSVLENEDSS